MFSQGIMRPARQIAGLKIGGCTWLLRGLIRDGIKLMFISSRGQKSQDFWLFETLARVKQ